MTNPGCGRRKNLQAHHIIHRCRGGPTVLRNLIAVCERRLKDEENFQCYFPNTYEKIEQLRLESLFGSRSYWENSLRVDLEVLAKRAVFVEAQQSLKLLDRMQFIQALQSFEYLYGDPPEPYPINELQFGWDAELIQQVNGFSNSLADALNRIDSLHIFNDACELTMADEGEFEMLLESYQQVGEDLKKWAEHMQTYGRNLRLSQARQRQLYCRLNDIAAADCDDAEVDAAGLPVKVLSNNQPDVFERALRIARRVQQTIVELQELDFPRQQDLDSIDRVALLLPLLQNDGLTQQEIEDLKRKLDEVKRLDREQGKAALVDVLAIIKRELSVEIQIEDVDFENIAGLLRGLIDDEQPYTDRALVALELLQDSDQFDNNRMERLRRSVMFFVSIADAEDKDAVKSILEVYTLPAVSYAEKRRLGDGFFISSYLGLGVADTDVHGSQEEASGDGLFVPIGIEYNVGRARGDSWSVMLSPIDMAYPVNLKLSGIEEDINFDELIAPSLTLAYGFREYPINIGVGYQKGRKLDDVDKSEEKWLLFVTFDMPLFRIY